MPKKPRIPKYSLHKPSGRARVVIDGRHIWLGKYGSPESHEKYRALIAELGVAPEAKVARPDNVVSVAELAAAYWRWAKGYYVKDGKPTAQLGHVKLQLKALKELYSATPVTDFGPLALQAVQAHLVESGLTRVGVNARCQGIRRVFKWGVAGEMVPASVYQALACVSGLRKGRTPAPECDPVKAIEDAVVDATLPYMPEVVADMVRLQRMTGARPGEVCILRPCDIDRSADVWIYRPESHKTEHHGRSRHIYIGPKVQAVLMPYLLRPEDVYCFSPSESTKRQLDRRHAQRTTPLGYGNCPGTNRKARRRRPAGDRYTKDSYRRAVHRAILKANKERTKEAEEAGTDPDLLPSWSPHRLRHTAATEIRKQFGLEAAQVTLGHAKADVTQIYAERDAELARSVAAKIG